MRRYSGVMLVAPLILAMALAACGGGDDTPTATAPADVSPTATSPGEATPTSTAESAPTAVASPIQRFTLEDLTVQVGTIVTWTNLDGASHTTTSGAPGSLSGVWDSGVLSNGGTFSFTFAGPGEFAYFCNIHPSMRATITVVEASSGASAAPAGDGGGGGGFSY